MRSLQGRVLSVATIRLFSAHVFTVAHVFIVGSHVVIWSWSWEGTEAMATEAMATEAMATEAMVTEAMVSDFL
jgi:hypothetical protein